jgi:hypothetical protein
VLPRCSGTAASVGTGELRGVGLGDLVAEVGLGDLGVGLDLGRGAGGDLLAGVQDGDPVADLHDEVHVVLDQQDAHPGRDGADQLAELVHLVLGQPGGGLVEEEQVGLGDEGAGEGDALLHRVREAARVAVGVALGIQLDQGPLRALAQQPVVLVGVGQGEDGGHETRLRVPVRTDHHVLEHGQPGEQADALQRARDAELAELARPEPAQLLVTPGDAAGRRADEAARHVEQRRLAGAVRADEAVHLTGLHRERDVTQRGHAPEGDADPAHLEPCGGRSFLRTLAAGVWRRLRQGAHCSSSSGRVRPPAGGAVGDDWVTGTSR